MIRNEAFARQYEPHDQEETYSNFDFTLQYRIALDPTFIKNAQVTNLSTFLHNYPEEAAVIFELCNGNMTKEDAKKSLGVIASNPERNTDVDNPEVSFKINSEGGSIEVRTDSNGIVDLV